MNDKQLLGLAAKAAGIPVMPCTCSDAKWPLKHDTEKSGKRGHWNPLVDDGDALRLAVKLNISINRPVDGDSVQHFGAYADDYTQTIQVKERDNGNPCAATRRAIVRAAAEIGKAMP